MKSLKIAAFVSVALYFIAHIVYEYLFIMELGRVFNHTAFIAKQNEMVAQYIAVPLTLIYLFKRFK